MSDTTTEGVVRIQPERVALARGGGATAEALEIALGGVPRGIVVVLGEGPGAGHEMVEVMNRFAEHGYESSAVENGAEADDADRLLHRAAERGWEPEQTAIIGIGAGGRIALAVAAEYSLGAAVSVSATSSASPKQPLHLVASAVRTPWLGLFGDLDPGAPREDTDALASALRAGSDVFAQVVRYPGVGADFHRRWTHGLEYAASYDGWQRVQEWLDARVAPRLTPRAVAWRRQRARA